jgi:hypothetical protein
VVIVDKQKLFFGYLLIFFGVFIMSLVYPMIPTLINGTLDTNVELPQNTYTVATNSTMGIQSISGNMSLLGTVIAISIVVAVLSASFGVRGMSGAF